VADDLPKMHPVLSSHIVAVGHDGDSLYVEFVDGKFARYLGVTYDVLDELLRSTSVGRTFNEKVRGQTSFTYLKDLPLRGMPDDTEGAASR
jgi:KTSC domain